MTTSRLLSTIRRSTIASAVIVGVGGALFAPLAAHAEAIPRETAPLIVNLAAEHGGSSYLAYGVDGDQLVETGRFLPSAEAAARKAEIARVPEIGQTGTVMIGDRCLAVSASPDQHLVVVACDGSDSQRWTRTPVGGLETASTVTGDRYIGNGDGTGVALLAPEDSASVGF